MSNLEILVKVLELIPTCVWQLTMKNLTHMMMWEQANTKTSEEYGVKGTVTSS